MTDVNLSGKGLDTSSIEDILSKVVDKATAVSIDLSNNLLSQMPRESILSQFENVEHIDITKNPISVSYTKVCLHLIALKRLTSLNVEISNEEELEIVLNTLPQLKLLNGEEIKAENRIIPTFENEKAKMFRYISRIINYIKNDIVSLENFNNEFEYLLKSNIESLNYHMTQSQLNYSITIHNANSELYSFFYSFIVENILLSQSQRMKMVLSDKDFKKMLKEIKNNITYNNDMMYLLSCSTSDSIEKCVDYFKSVLNEKDKEIERLNTEAKEKEIKYSKIEKENKKYMNENMFLYENIQKAKEENETVLTKIFAKVNEICDTMPTEVNSNLTRNSYIPLQTAPTTLQTSPNNKRRYVNNGNSIKVKVVKDINDKQISLFGLLEIINEVYKSKDIQDKKNLMSKEPQETLEQHLYTYLNHKYGLKNLIVEKAYRIIMGIKKYSQNNSRVCLFGKIMRNEIDEGSIEIINKLQSSLYDLICYSKEVPSFDTTTFIVDKELIEYISKCLYSKSKSETELFSKKIKEKGNNITYAQLFDTILEVHIITRSYYLKNFKTLFNRFDTDNNGILNRIQAKGLLSAIMRQVNTKAKLSDDDIMLYVVNQIDTDKTNVLTFSNFVKFLESIDTYLKPKAQNEASLLDLLAAVN